MVQRQVQEERRARKETRVRMKTIKREARARKSVRTREAQKYVKRIDVEYIDGYVENKPSQ